MPMRNIPKKKILHSLSLNIDVGQQNAGKLMVTHFNNNKIIYLCYNNHMPLIDDILAVKIIQKNILVSSTVVNGPPRTPYFTCSKISFDI